ncbi:hypothetical protein BO86DRAFT_401093 [Aspergillus japonicus CBS 114.51]|uniref:Uncharacterized protein n=1 Tax=Aspergillus japonicus CBS 114.51 TaxID=1448312 RepID=A0A8T8WW81_ASPJA|nr:hypothetical protein BO86DRAFT_401093 [Aspergillus japonicus CBS 114.51]RAH80095.1 hypothetical protein BO86DRAFT_401093 [Aspergillus japonicus CBS 114.51]
MAPASAPSPSPTTPPCGSTTVAQSDVMPDADLHNATPASRNPHKTDLGTGLPRRNRWGVYLHWTLPRVYRTGVATAAREEDEHGQEGVAPAQRSSSRSKCFDAPTRWLIIRKLALDSVRPVAAAAEVSEYEAWVVESDHVWHLDDISLEADF